MSYKNLRRFVDAFIHCTGFVQLAAIEKLRCRYGNCKFGERGDAGMTNQLTGVGARDAYASKKSST